MKYTQLFPGRATIRNPDFEEERVAAMTSVEGVTVCVIQDLRIPGAHRSDPFTRSLAQRVTTLNRMFAEEDLG